MKKLLFPILGALVFATGCAVSPQQITVEPRSEANFSGSGAGTSINLQVRDNRGTTALGSLGGTYPETSMLTTSNDVAADLNNLLRQKLTAAGYVVTPNNADFNLVVSLNELSYEYGTAAVVAREVQTVVELAFRAENASGMSYREGRFRTPRTQPRATRPTPEENKAFLEEVLTETIDRLLAHQPLVEFLR
ncbi:YajG family lipoprotein [Salinispirillum sp. LH 10-3-1]|uniref:YajG family lipoprotein n=1 Tax=Salinispirillum sp. LH 10-3-1 TaxID=2952525 RepID=A0AB38YJW3_9GAMM